VSGVIDLQLNGRAVALEGEDPRTPLLQVLRSRGMYAAKEGCAEGECGACAVVVRDEGADGLSRYEAVQSCLVPAGSMHGKQCWTVEALGKPGALHPVQSALAEHAGSQCGYCTPGFVSTLFAHYHRAPRPDPVHALGGNLCRCTGYRPIVDAARSLPQVADDDAFARALRTAVPPEPPLRVGQRGVLFERPTTLPAALQLRARYPDATLLAGGTDLLVQWLDGSPPEQVIALDAVRELRAFRRDGEALELGAGLTFADLESHEIAAAPLWRELLPLFASRQIRARATLGGNVMTASPVGDLPPVLLALDAELVLASVRGVRAVPASELFVAYRKTAIAPDELLTAIRLREPAQPAGRFYKVQRRAADDIACVSLAAVLQRDADGVVTRARIAYGGAAATPVRVRAAELALEGTRCDGAALANAQQAALAALSPISDTRGSAEYRRALLTGLLAKLQHELPA
jgi:xanthine dehydrogenase small subunit